MQLAFDWMLMIGQFYKIVNQYRDRMEMTRLGVTHK